MKTKTILGFVLATLIALFAISSVAATLSATIGTVSVNDVDLSVGSLTTISGSPGEIVPVIVRFTADADALDVKVKASIGDGNSVSTSRFDVLNGTTYVKRLSLALPNVNDVTGSSESWNLQVIVSDKTGEEVPSNYLITMQRDSFSIELLSVEGPSAASAGDVLSYDVVVKNTGSRDSQDTFVTVSIPELGISKKVYFGDIVSTDTPSSNDNEDAMNRRVYLTLPANVKSGDYTVEIKASNYDTTDTAKKLVSVTGTSTDSEGNVIKPTGDNGKGIPTSVIVLTVALVIIFLVLLVVLIVLLTKKPSEKSEDFGETSYY